MPTLAAFAINDEQAAFVQKGVSITVGACNALRVPSVARALGCTTASEGQRIILYISKVQAADVLQDIALNGRAAVVFSEPSTHKTIQLKGKNAFVTEIDDHALDIIEKHEHDFAIELLAVGFSREFTHGLLNCPTSELVAITFTLVEAFSQTPGPKAGESLSSAT